MVHNYLQTVSPLQITADCLAFDIKSSVIKMYKYFHIYNMKSKTEAPKI